MAGRLVCRQTGGWSPGCARSDPSDGDRAAQTGARSGHPYRSTPQYEQSRTPSRSGGKGKRLYDCPARRQTNDASTLALVFGELHEGDAHYAVEDTGRTDAPRGHQRHGTTRVAVATDLLERYSGHSIDDLKACLVRGKLTLAMRAIHADLEDAVFAICDARKATRKALAEALGCTPRTIARLRSDGAGRCADAA